MKSLKAFFPGETYIEYGFPFTLQTLPRKTVQTALTLAILGWKITEKKDSSDEKAQPEMHPTSKKPHQPLCVWKCSVYQLSLPGRM